MATSPGCSLLRASRAALSGRLVVSWVFVCAVPRLYSKTERVAALSDLVHCKVGDTDNWAKSALDALTASVWGDDKQVAVYTSASGTANVMRSASVLNAQRERMMSGSISLPQTQGDTDGAA